MYMLDTNICSYLLKNQYPSVLRRFERVPTREVCVSPITVAEMRYGIEKFQRKSPNSIKYTHPLLDNFLAYFTIPMWGQEAAAHYGAIRAQLEQEGRIIDKMDVLIAAHAMQLDAVLVTNNVKHFHAISGLNVENWID